MGLKLSNNASGLLALAISDSDTSLTLEAGHGSRFPVLGSGDWFPITVVRASDPSQFEIMRCTGRSGDTLTVERAQEGTSALAFDPGDVVELRLTAGTLEENFPQVEARAAKQLRFGVSDDSMGRPDLEFANASKTVKALANKGSLGATNLDLATDTGLYSQPEDANALPELNYPTNRAGVLLSSRNNVDVQLYLTYQREAFLRGGQASLSPWRRFAFADEIGELKGKRMLFLEATAPPGWTQDTSINDRVIRVVSSAGGGTGGSWTLSGLTIASTTLSAAQGAVHNHSGTANSAGAHSHGIPTGDNSGYGGFNPNINGSTSISSRSAGAHTHTLSINNSTGGSSHTHGISSNGSWRPAYVNVIACTKD